ncbi:aldo/keto reductase [Algibacter mikhailovii]|uniref:aldo/keto reductase n=1 Tax=Algibacter mikhailovii TaxID=425498 RepID=UPI0034E1BDA0
MFFYTAPSYNRSEEYPGKALKNWSACTPCISTKIGNVKSQKGDGCVVDYTAEILYRTAYKSLRTLGVKKIDSLFLHELISNEITCTIIN